MEKELILEFDKKQKKQKRTKESHASTSSKAKHPKVEEPEISHISLNYRDRAKERREGINKDFELDPDDLKLTNPTLDGADQDEGEQPTDEAELRRRQIEESKYLGGDVEHTHLVKGLDFALLERVKNDQKLAEKVANELEAERKIIFGDQASDSEEEDFINEAILAAGAAANSKKQIVDLEKLKKGQSTDMIPCRTAIARRILNVLDEQWPEKSELFLPGRMSYIVPIDEDTDESVTTILRSRADASVIDESKMPTESDFALDQLINILSKIRKRQTSTDSLKNQRSWELDDDLI